VQVAHELVDGHSGRTRRLLESAGTLPELGTGDDEGVRGAERLKVLQETGKG
jgi:hypothetical protein